VIKLFTDWLAKFVQLGLELAFALIKGVFSAPGTAAKRMVAPVTVRRGTADEVVDLRMRVLRPGKPRADAVWDGDAEPDARHWVAEHDDRIVGIASVIRRKGADGGDWQLRGMAVDPAHQGHGVGRAVLDALVAEVAAPMWCNARVTAIPFYEKAGWKVTSDVFDTGVGPHRRMTRV
jgi:GNAT superfamily N-acetyltransferase